MNNKSKLVFGAMCALFCGLCLSSEASGQTLPDGKGKAEFVRICSGCHRTDVATHLKRTPDEWRKNVNDMVARGADGSQEEIDNIVLYLSTNFGPDKSGPAAVPQSTPPASTAGTATAPNISEAEHVKQIIADNGCLACHRVEKQGGYTGPTLNGVGGKRSAEEIRSAIVSPHKTLDPSNNLIQLTTADGKTHVGRILSQDDHEVRVIDAVGDVGTYPKQGVRELKVVSTSNPMPAFEGKIKGEDLDGLVRYLGSLPALDEIVQK
jgi:putative heme-binding domain-containing protein